MRVQCPRCPATGEVHPDTEWPGYFYVTWTHPDEPESWVDRMVTQQDLDGPRYGCGYDGKAARDGRRTEGLRPGGLKHISGAMERMVAKVRAVPERGVAANPERVEDEP